MNNKVLYGGMIVIVVSLFVATIVFKKPEPPRPGTAQADKGGEHVASKKYGGVEPPTSGDHGATTSWGVHKEEVADVNVLHNLEHGGIYISYQPDIPADEIKKIEQLFSVPSSRDKFNAAKAVVAPRAKNKANIVVSSWNRSKQSTSFDERAMYEYYVSNLNKSPEPFAN